MTKKGVSPATVHMVPVDLRKALVSVPDAQAAWEDRTPLARNEWICWIISTLKPETIRNHVERTISELIDEMRRLVVDLDVFTGQTSLYALPYRMWYCINNPSPNSLSAATDNLF